MYPIIGKIKYLHLSSVTGVHKKAWKVDPLSCSKCGSEMKIISFINQTEIIRKNPECLGLCKGKAPVKRAPPVSIPEKNYEPYYEYWPEYEEPFVTN